MTLEKDLRELRDAATRLAQELRAKWGHHAANASVSSMQAPRSEAQAETTLAPIRDAAGLSEARIDVGELRRLAEASRPKHPWLDVADLDKALTPLADFGDDPPAYARYIAAVSPYVLVALLDRLERAEAAQCLACESVTLPRRFSDASEGRVVTRPCEEHTTRD